MKILNISGASFLGANLVRRRLTKPFSEAMETDSPEANCVHVSDIVVEHLDVKIINQFYCEVASNRFYSHGVVEVTPYLSGASI